jgi:cell wall assembly regulator SMI1
MQKIWDRITSWLTIHAPEISKSLQPGATEDEIREVEATLGLTFPADVHQSFRIYNGQYDLLRPLIRLYSLPEDLDLDLDDCRPEPLLTGWKLLSLVEIVRCWNEWMSLRNLGEADWNRFWIPITDNESGNHHCLDLDPTLGQRISRIILVDHEYIHDIESDPDFKQYDNFSVWLESFATDLESNTYEYAEEYCLLIHPESLREIRLNRPIHEAKIQETMRILGFEFDE